MHAQLPTDTAREQQQAQLAPTNTQTHLYCCYPQISAPMKSDFKRSANKFGAQQTHAEQSKSLLSVPTFALKITSYKVCLP